MPRQRHPRHAGTTVLTHRPACPLVLHLVCLAALAGMARAHPGHGPADQAIRIWTVSDGRQVKASFVMARDGVVCLRDEAGEVVVVGLSRLGEADQAWVRQR